MEQEQSFNQLLTRAKDIYGSDNPNLAFFRNINEISNVYVEYVLSKFNKWKDDLMVKEVVNNNGVKETRYLFSAFTHREDIFDILFLGKYLLNNKDYNLINKITSNAKEKFILTDSSLRHNQDSSVDSLRNGLSLVHAIRCQTSHTENGISVNNDCIEISIDIDDEQEKVVLQVPLLYLEETSNHKINVNSQDYDVYMDSLKDYKKICDLLGIDYNINEELMRELIKNYKPSNAKKILEFAHQDNIDFLKEIDAINALILLTIDENSLDLILNRLKSPDELKTCIFWSYFGSNINDIINNVDAILKMNEEYSIADIFHLPEAVLVSKDNLEFFINHSKNKDIKDLYELHIGNFLYIKDENDKLIGPSDKELQERILFLLSLLKEDRYIENLKGLEIAADIGKTSKKRIKFLLKYTKKHNLEELKDIPVEFWNEEEYTEKEIKDVLKKAKTKVLSDLKGVKVTRNNISFVETFNPEFFNNYSPEFIDFLKEHTKNKKYSDLIFLSSHKVEEKIIKFLLQFTENQLVEEIELLKNALNAKYEIFNIIMSHIPDDEKRFIHKLPSDLWDCHEQRLNFLLGLFNNNPMNFIGFNQHMFMEDFCSEKRIKEIIEIFGNNPSDISELPDQCFLDELNIRMPDFDFGPHDEYEKIEGTVPIQRIKKLYEYAGYNIQTLKKYPVHLYRCSEVELDSLIKEYNTYSLNRLFISNDAISITNAMLSRSVFSSFDSSDIYNENNKDFILNVDLSKFNIKTPKSIIFSNFSSRKEYDEEDIKKDIINEKQIILTHLRNACEHINIERVDKTKLCLKDYDNSGVLGFEATIEIEDFFEFCENIFYRKYNDKPLDLNIFLLANSYSYYQITEDLIVLKHPEYAPTSEDKENFFRKLDTNNRGRKAAMKEFYRGTILKRYYDNNKTIGEVTFNEEIKRSLK